MLARVAENLYWQSRYLERVECTARMLTTLDSLLMDLQLNAPDAAWMTLVSITGADDGFLARFDAPTEERVCAYLVSEPDNPGSIVSGIRAARENLRSSRDSLSTVVYESINDLYHLVNSIDEKHTSAVNRQALLKKIIRQCLVISGAIEGSISHDQGYLFLRIGSLIERADMTSRILDVRSANLLPNEAGASLTPFEDRQWVAVLRSVSAYQMYLRQTRKSVSGPDVLSFLLQNPTLPRSYLFCLDQLGLYLRQLDNSYTPVRRLQRLRRLVVDADVMDLANNRAALHQFIDGLQLGLAHMGNGISKQYFPSPND